MAAGAAVLSLSKWPFWNGLWRTAATLARVAAGGSSVPLQWYLHINSFLLHLQSLNRKGRDRIQGAGSQDLPYAEEITAALAHFDPRDLVQAAVAEEG